MEGSCARVIESLLDPEQPFRKQILKRSELLNLYYGKAQCYHIEQDWVKGEPAFRELLKFADAAKDETKHLMLSHALPKCSSRISESMKFSLSTKIVR